MKKKFLLFFILVFSLFLIVGCGSKDPDVYTPYDGTEYLAEPLNLEIDGKVLSWDAVAGAEKYAVYANGKRKATVKSTTYDFGKISDDYITFFVIAMGKNYTNSGRSLTVAYHSNINKVLNDLWSVSVDYGMKAPEDFINELAKRGVTGTKFSDDIEAIMNFSDVINEAGDFENLNSALTDLLASELDYAAYVSAILKVYGPQLEAQYNQTTDPVEKEMLAMIIDMYDSEFDNMVMALTNVVEYLFDVYQYCGEDVFALMADLVNPEAMIETTFAIKSEVIEGFLEEMPQVRDVAVLYRLYAALMSLNTDNDELVEFISESASALANASLLQFEFGLKLLDSYDYDFYTELEELMETAPTDEMLGIETIILAVKNYKDFIDDNSALINKIDKALTEEQKTKLIIGYSEMQYEMIEEMLGTEIEFNSELYMDIMALSEKTGEQFLDYFVESDGAILRKIAVQGGFDYDYDVLENIYYNSVTGIDYDFYNEWQYDSDIAMCELLSEMVAFYNATLGTLTADEFHVFSEYYFDNFKLVLTEGDEMYDLIVNFEVFFFDHIAEVQNLPNDLISYMDEEEVFDNLADVFTDIYDYYNNEYGMVTDWDEIDDDYKDNAMLIYIAKNFEPFVTTQKNTIENFITDFFEFLEDEVTAGNIPDLTLEDLADFEAAVDKLFDEGLPMLSEIKAFNVNNLSADQLKTIDDFNNLYN